MKKVISIVLALLMMVPVAAMLVPTASAATTANTAHAGTTGKVYYEQDFNNPAWAELSDVALADAIGWAKPSEEATMWIENGKLRVVTQYYPDSNANADYTAIASKWGGGYSSGILFQDEEVLRNTMVAEFKLTYNRRARGPENDIVVNENKTVNAYGQGGDQAAYFIYAGNKAIGSVDNSIGRIYMSGNGWTKGLKAPDSASNNTLAWKTTTFEQVYGIAEGDTCQLEYTDSPTGTGVTSKIMNREYSIKVIMEPWAHRFYLFVDGELYSTMNVPTNTNMYSINDWGRMMSDAVQFYAKPGVDVTVDDIKFSEYVPNLTISEVMANGSKANATGKYQWIEITNPSDAPVNVYDYAIHLNNMPVTDKRQYLIGDDQDNGVNAWNVGAGSTLGYFTPGEKTLGDEVFNSPAYEDGVLQPGESAIVLFPQTAMAGGTSVTDTAFKAYLQGLGMPEGTMVLVADNESDYNFTIGLLANESAVVQIVKATNTATDGGYAPVADCKGKYAEYSPAYAECTAIVSGKGSNSGTAWYGLQMKTSGSYKSNWPVNAHDVGTASTNPHYAINTDKSYEINYSGWINGYAVQNVDFDHTNIKWGFPKYGPNETRKNAVGEDVYATPGYVPVECRRVQHATVVAADGTSSKLILNPGYTATVSVATPKKTGYAAQVWVDGVMVVAEAAGTVTDVTIAATNAERHTVEVKYHRDGSYFIGFQKSEVAEDGTYTLRLLAAINDPDAYESFGFNILMTWDGGWESKEVSTEAGYVYEAVTAYTDGDATVVTAADYGFEYLYALHIKNVPSDIEDLEIYASATYTVNGETKTAPEGDQYLALNVVE